MITANGPVTIGTSMAGNLASTPIKVEQDSGFSVQLVWTGSPVGNWTLEGSNDQGEVHPDNTITGVSNWTTVDDSTSAAGGAAGELMYNIHFCYFRWFRVVYTSTSGTGTVTSARFQLKDA